jgi:glycerol uptake operon antiterminator
MLTRSTRSLLNLPATHKTIPLLENRVQFALALDAPDVTTIMLRHCNLFDLRSLLEHAHERDLAVYVNMDHIDGIAPDLAGFRYLATQLHITGVLSSHGRVLALAKSFDMQTIQHIFAVDSTGLEAALESVDDQQVDLLAISPALVIPYAVAQVSLHLPYIGCGFVSTHQQVQRILNAGAIGVTVSRPELWM